MASTEDTKFPVFFPVSREFGWRKVRTRLRPPPASLGLFYSFQFDRNRYFAARLAGIHQNDRRRTQASACSEEHSCEYCNGPEDAKLSSCVRVFTIARCYLTGGM